MATYRKTDFVKELTEEVGVKRKETIALLDKIFEIVCREAKIDGFSFPGLFKIDMVTRKQRRMRNPQTGQAILITEHQAPRIRILKKAKDIISADESKKIIPLDDQPTSAASAPFTPPPTASAPVPEKPESKPESSKPGFVPPKPPAPTAEEEPSGIVYDDFSVAVSFKCQACDGEIEAPAAASGLASECPVCGQPVVIPFESEAGTIHGPKMDSDALNNQVEAAAEKAFSEAAFATQKNQTIRIDLSTLDTDAPEAPKAKPRIVSFFCKNCNQELEAPAEMMGMKSECPDCSANFEVPFFSDPGTLHGSDLEKSDVGKPGNVHNRTIRIEMPDF